jgi:dienelactone hydrolase
MTTITIGSECDFVGSAITSYNLADNVVRILTTQRRIAQAAYRSNMGILRGYIQGIENSIWEALARDYPKFKFRRQNQTIVVNYYGDGQAVYINPGEVYKIRAWGVNDYYEALDTINRLQNRLWNNTASLDRRWMDDWKRLDNQLTSINRRNCKGFYEPSPGPIIITPPICLPKPPNPPGPELPIYPCPPVPAQGSWSASDTRNWAIAGWTPSDFYPAIGYIYNRPTINKIDGRELIFYRTPGTNPTKIVWLFHGAGGSARSWFTDYEKVKYVKKFIDAGYAVAAYESYNRISKKWTLTVNPATNREIIGLTAAKAYLSSIGLLPSNQYGVGMSAGGAMVSYAAGPLDLRKIVIHNASGIDSIIRNANYNIATLWMVSNNDLIVNNSQANDNYNYLLVNKPSIASAYYMQQATKITSTIFDDVPFVSTPVAQAIVSGLLSGGFISAGGDITDKYLLAGRSVREGYLQNTIPAIVSAAFGNDQETYRKYASDIMDQIKIAFSDHEFSGWQRTEVGGTLTLVDRDLAFINS